MTAAPAHAPLLEELNAALRAILIAKRLLKDDRADVALRVFEAECRIRRAILAELCRETSEIAEMVANLRKSVYDPARIAAIERGTMNGRPYRKTAYTDRPGVLLEVDLGDRCHEECFLGAHEQADERLNELTRPKQDDDRR